MKKLLFLILPLYFFLSCAKLEKRACEVQFNNIVKHSYEKNKIKKVRGSIYIKGIILLFNASFDKKTDIKLFSPIGTYVAEFLETDEEVCLKIKDNKICGKAPLMYKEVFQEEIPFSLTDIVTGHFKISPDSNYECKGTTLTVKEKDKTYIYQKGLLKELKYKDFSLIYEYEDQKPEKVELKVKNNTLAKIFIRDIE